MYLIHRSYRLAIVAAILSVVVPFLLIFFENSSGGAMCYDSCGVFSGKYPLPFFIFFNLLCVTLYISRKKVKYGGSKAWIIPEIVALFLVVPTLIDAGIKFSQTLIEEFTSMPFGNYYSFSSPQDLFWQIFIITIGFWTIGAYLLVWYGARAEDAGSTRQKPLKGLLVLFLFIVMLGTVFAILFYLSSLRASLENDAMSKKCKADFIEFQKELALATCTTDHDCSVDELKAREREQIKEPYGTDLYFSQNLEISSRFYDLETSRCGNLRLYCEANKCVPKK